MTGIIQFIRRAMLVGMALIIATVIILTIRDNATDPNRQIWRFEHLHYDAVLNEDGSASVSETRVYDFERGSYTFAWFDLAPEARDIVVLEDGVAYERLDEPLSSRPESSYVVAPGEESDAWRVTWYFRAAGPQERTFEVRYVIPDAAFSYDDCTVYFQKFLSETNETEIGKVSVSIRLPEGAAADNTKIFGHGPVYGSLDFATDDPRRVDMLVEDIGAGQYVEARFLLPANILAGAPRRQGNVYDDILAEELAAARKADREALAGRFGLALALLLMLALLAATVVLRIKYKHNYRRLRPELNPPYMREAPSPLPPAIVSRLAGFYGKTPSAASLISVCLIDLISRRAISAEVRQEGRREVTYLRRLPGDPGLLECEKPIIAFVFGEAAGGKDLISLKDLKRYCRSQRHLREITRLLNSFSSSCNMLWQSYGFEEKKRNEVPRVLIHLRLAALAAAVISFFMFFWLFPAMYSAALVLLIGGILSLLFNLIFCHKRKLLSQRGENELALWLALRRFFDDLTAFDEKELPELGLWEKLLVYATALGVADKVIRKLKLRYPQLDDPDFTRRYFYGYAGLHMLGNRDNSFSGLGNSLSSSFRSAQAVVTSRTASSGGGGGFSGGGSSGGGGAGGSSGGGVG